MQTIQSRLKPLVSIGIIAWNEEKAIGPMLDSLFEQSLFAVLSGRGQSCEIICLVNGSTDGTARVAREHLQRHALSHPFADAFSGRVVEVSERGKINSWNRFVHEFSARDARFLFLMDADILIHRPDTLWNMVLTLECNAEAHVAVDRPCKDIEFKTDRTWRDRLSLAASQMTRSSDAQLCGQLYCIRSRIARNIYLPKDLAACEDGFIKTMVCTDFLAHPVWPMRIRKARDAAHTFEAYTSVRGLLKNQKRQMIGQTIVHVLVDGHLKKLPPLQRSRMADTLREMDRANPGWLKELIQQHVRATRHFWQLYPGLLSFRFRRLARLNPLKQILCLPAALAGWAASLASSFAASRFLRAGSTSYWPSVERNGFARLELERQRAEASPR